MGEVTMRRSLEQTKHCVEEALSVVREEEEDIGLAVDDLEQAASLIQMLLPKMKKIRDAKRAAAKEFNDSLPKYVPVKPNTPRPTDG